MVGLNAFYNFLTGTGVWISLIIFFGGLVIRATFLYGLSRERDGQFFNHFDWGWSLKSVINWLIPLGSVSLRRQPVFGLAFFLFHLCLLATPLFLAAHNIMWEEAWGWSLPSLPDGLADVMTLVVIACAAFLFVRRLVRREVRIITGAWDYLVLLLTAAPFVSGFLAYHQAGDYRTTIVLHVLFGEVMLIVIPFTKLGHLMLFFFTRAFIGSEMGARRQVDGRLGARVW
ncbi:MAG: TmcC family electron transfer complex membrane anchor subunit [Thermodesulfobacteriota bacterium]